MTGKIFRGILVTALLTMTACLLFIIGMQYQFYTDTRKQSLENQAYIISRTVDSGGDIRDFGKLDDRITLIDKNGEVLYDNKADVSDAENHSDRQEFRQALENGTGSSSRFSQTLEKHTYYYAVKLKDGTVLRVAGENITLLNVILGLLPAISAIIIMTFIIALITAFVTSKRIIAPINAINPDKPDIESEYEELTPLIGKLMAQNKRIDRQITELTRSRKEFEIISENMKEGIILTDSDGGILTYNRSITRLFDTETDLKGKNILCVSREDVFYRLLCSISSGLHSEYPISRKEQSLEIITNPVFDELNRCRGAVILVIDVTEKQERERLRREFTANVSHELKTPLTSILGFSEILKEGLAESADVKNFGDDINRETRRLISLVEDIIKLSRLDEGILDNEKQDVELKYLAEEVRERLLTAADAKGICFEVEGETVYVNANPGLIFEMVYNLCDNAIKYNREGGKVTVVTGMRGKKPFISVSDTGIGIAAEHKDRIFERFYRVDRSRSDMSGGTGLGLSIVKRIAGVSGAAINLDSKLGEGTQITVTFDK